MKKYLMIMALLITAPAGAAEISEARAVHCILGEAAGEYAKNGFDAFLAIAEALRNRGTTRGVYGCGVNLDKDMAYLNAKGLPAAARRAWTASTKSNLTGGASHWESTDFPRPAWSKKMKITYTIGKHQFFK